MSCRDGSRTLRLSLCFLRGPCMRAGEYPLAFCWCRATVLLGRTDRQTAQPLPTTPRVTSVGPQRIIFSLAVCTEPQSVGGFQHSVLGGQLRNSSDHETLVVGAPTDLQSDMERVTTNQFHDVVVRHTVPRLTYRLIDTTTDTAVPSSLSYSLSSDQPNRIPPSMAAAAAAVTLTLTLTPTRRHLPALVGVAHEVVLSPRRRGRRPLLL